MERVDLKDVTFLLVLRVETEERLKNFLTVLHYLQAHVDAPIMVLEAGTLAGAQPDKNIDGYAYRFIEDASPDFHRTRYLNMMLSAATTPIVCIYDVDIICPPEQLVAAANLIRQGRAVLALPFEQNSFYVMPETFREKFAASLDPALLDPNESTKHGGCNGAVVLADRKIYREVCGGENEEFLSWGDEDSERIVRVSRMGYTVSRTAGNVYHLDHERKHSAALYEAGKPLLARALSMSPGEMTAYVRAASWSPRQEYFILRHLLHDGNDIYAYDRDTQRMPYDAQGWRPTDPTFRELIAQEKPSFIVEVGTWKGASALHMATVCKELGLKTTIFCVDTWLGSLEFWDCDHDTVAYSGLAIRNGYPRVYDQFRSNVIHDGHADCILPFPATSRTAAKFMARKDLRPQVVFLDGSHEYEDVRDDIRDYLDILAPGGLMFGDDYDVWPGVRAAFDEATGRLHGVPLSTIMASTPGQPTFWTIRKRS